MELLHKSVTVQSDTGCFFRNRISCGNRDKTDRKKLCCQDRASFIYVTDGADVKIAVTIPETRIAGSS